MTQEKAKETVNTAVKRGRELVARGNRRHLLIRNKDGEKIAEVTMTVAVLTAIVLFFIPPWGWLLALAGGILAMASKVRIELVRELSEDDEVVQVEIPQE